MLLGFVLLNTLLRIRRLLFVKCKFWDLTKDSVVFVLFKDLLQLELRTMSENEVAGFSYAYTIWLTCFEQRFLQRNTVSCCTIVEHKRVRSSMISIAAIFRSIQ